MNLRDRMQVKLAEAKQEARMLSVMALNSSLPPEYRQLVKMLECLARTEAKLRRSALDQLALDSKAKTMGWSPIRPVDGADNHARGADHARSERAHEHVIALASRGQAASW